MEPPQRAEQGGPLEQNGGKKLCLQDGASDGSTDFLSVETSSTHCLYSFRWQSGQ